MAKTNGHPVRQRTHRFAGSTQAPSGVMLAGNFDDIIEEYAKKYGVFLDTKGGRRTKLANLDFADVDGKLADFLLSMSVCMVGEYASDRLTEAELSRIAKVVGEDIADWPCKQTERELSLSVTAIPFTRTPQINGKDSHSHIRRGDIWTYCWEFGPAIVSELPATISMVARDTANSDTYGTWLIKGRFGDETSPAVMGDFQLGDFVASWFEIGNFGVIDTVEATYVG